MRVYIQWALASPADWEPVDVRNPKAVRDLPSKPEPAGGETLDNSPGWVVALNCQGIVFTGYDHIAVETVGQGLVITGWLDDPEDHGDFRAATAWRLDPPAPDPAIGGRINTVQTRTIYTTHPDEFTVPTESWEAFSPPPANMTRHGIWLPDTVWRDTIAARSLHGWREWAT